MTTVIDTQQPQTTNIISAHKWPEMSLGELHAQKSIMLNRIAAAQEAGATEVMNQLINGMTVLDQLINTKGRNEGTLI